MQKFQNILYVFNALETNKDSLIQALSLARNNNAALTIFVLCPNITDKYIKKIEIYSKKHQEIFSGQVEAAINEICSKFNIERSTLNISMILEEYDNVAVQIVQHVLRNAIDLVLKDAESTLNTSGFKAIDMKLLRICPCPVWLCRPITKHRNQISVAVAIDPNDEEQAAHDLSILLLELARSIADACDGRLKILSLI